MRLRRTIVLAVALWSLTLAHAADSLPPLPDGRVPQTVEELWSGYDPRREPLEIQVVREWQDDGLTCRYLTFTIGTFKGTKARMAAFYAFPKSAGKLPAARWEGITEFSLSGKGSAFIDGREIKFGNNNAG